jgi:hypothetical protein
MIDRRIDPEPTGHRKHEELEELDMDTAGD